MLLVELCAFIDLDIVVPLGVSYHGQSFVSARRIESLVGMLYKLHVVSSKRLTCMLLLTVIQLGLGVTTVCPYSRLTVLLGLCL